MIVSCPKCGGLRGDPGEVIAGTPCSCPPTSPSFPTLWKTITQPAPQTPHRCPVCDGHGIVAAGFYASVTGVSDGTSTAPEQCRACGGTGVIIC